MVLDSVERMAPEVVTACRRRAASANGVPREPDRSTVLTTLMAMRGSRSVLEVYKYARPDTPSSALLLFMLNSESPAELFQKLEEYKRHLHPTREVRACEVGENYVIAENRVPPSEPYTVADDLFICGAVSGMMLHIGCIGLDVDWLTARSTALQGALRELGLPPSPLDTNTRWRFRWKASGHRGRINGLDEFFLANAEPFATPTQTVSHAVERLLAQNLNRRPTLSEIAGRLGMTSRTLQRKLAAEGTSFVGLYNELRIETAARLLRQNDQPITEVALLAGYTDGAHLCREFKRARNLSPRDYRASFCTRGNTVKDRTALD